LNLWERQLGIRHVHHAAYDDTHPVEALDIIHALLGDQPDLRSVSRVRHAIQKSYDLYRLALDVGMGTA
jgi:pyrroloquinoline quinone (PQQ) biosynthesis protein C